MDVRTYQAMPASRILRKYAAVPNEHGSWVFLFSPLLTGMILGRAWTVEGWLLAVTALSGFMLRQPVTLLVKVASRRRPKSDLPAALFWVGIYALIAAGAFALLAVRGYAYLAYLAIPVLITLAWHLWLVSRRNERRQAGVEIVASGTLALTAPAAYWIGVGEISSTGWWLWGLFWLQAASSIVYAYLRLEQRGWKTAPDLRARLFASRRALLYTSGALAVVLLASLSGILPKWLFLAYSVQWIESLWGAANPAVGVKPTRIGIRQLIVSVIFMVVFLITWRLSPF